jgi:hypothetical protein
VPSLPPMLWGCDDMDETALYLRWVKREKQKLREQCLDNGASILPTTGKEGRWHR